MAATCPAIRTSGEPGVPKVMAVGVAPSATASAAMVRESIPPESIQLIRASLPGSRREEEKALSTARPISSAPERGSTAGGLKRK